MQIIYNNRLNKISFVDLQRGDVFKYNEILFMKTVTIATVERAYNAVRLDDGIFTDFIDEYVEPVKGKFIMD